MTCKLRLGVELNETRPAITAELGAFVANCESSRFAPDERRLALTGIVDCCGVLVAGSMEEAPLILERTLDPVRREARLYFGKRLAAVPEAAWINATAAHALDFDDVAIRGHPSAVLVPAILAEASVREVTGSDVVDAFIIGYEAWAELVLRDPDQHHRKGWHPTGLFGCVGAAAACARILRLNGAQTTNALALAASRSAGLMANFGSMAKPLHAGQAAHAGVMSARLASAGMTASADAIEHPQGLLMATSPEGGVNLNRPVRAGTYLLRHGLDIKQYPTCLSTHRGLDGIRELMSAHAVNADDVARVTISMSRRNAMILRHHRPTTALEGEFSMEFATAAALISGSLTLSELRDEFVRRPDVQALMEKVYIEPTDQEDVDTGYAPFDTVSIQLRSGRVLETRVSAARGSRDRPFGAAELLDKFRTCLEFGKFGPSAEDFYEALTALDQPRPIRELIGKWL